MSESEPIQKASLRVFVFDNDHIRQRTIERLRTSLGALEISDQYNIKFQKLSDTAALSSYLGRLRSRISNTLDITIVTINGQRGVNSPVLPTVVTELAKLGIPYRRIAIISTLPPEVDEFVEALKGSSNSFRGSEDETGVFSRFGNEAIHNFLERAIEPLTQDERIELERVSAEIKTEEPVHTFIPAPEEWGSGFSKHLIRKFTKSKTW